jgi:hypothetical protein
MPYTLRPESKLKRPARFNSPSDDEFDNTPDPRNQPGITHKAVPWFSSGPSSQSILTSPFITSVRLPSVTPGSSLHPSTQSDLFGSHDMARIKHIRKGPRNEDSDAGEAPAVRRPRGRPATQPPQIVGQQSIFPSVRPAAFPSLSTYIPEPESLPLIEDRHGLRAIMQARKKSDDKALERSMRQVADMYDNKSFPDHVDGRERIWYMGLKKRWGENESNAEVSLFIATRDYTDFAIQGQVRLTLPIPTSNHCRASSWRVLNRILL